MLPGVSAWHILASSFLPHTIRFTVRPLLSAGALRDFTANLTAVTELTVPLKVLFAVLDYFDGVGPWRLDAGTSVGLSVVFVVFVIFAGSWRLGPSGRADDGVYGGRSPDTVALRLAPSEANSAIVELLAAVVLDAHLRLVAVVVGISTAGGTLLLQALLGDSLIEEVHTFARIAGVERLTGRASL